MIGIVGDTSSLEPCGCGQPARYFVADGKTACNKQMRCPTYDELNARLGDILGLMFHLKRILDSANDYGWCVCCGVARDEEMPTCSNPLCLTHEISKMCPELPVIPERKSDVLS